MGLLPPVYLPDATGLSLWSTWSSGSQALGGAEFAMLHPWLDSFSSWRFGQFALVQPDEL